MSSQYLYAPGLKELALGLEESPVIYSGVLPMAKMAMGDWAKFLIFPSMLSAELAERDDSLRVKCIFVIPDWMTDEYELTEANSFNIKLEGRTYNNQPDPEACHNNRVEHWVEIFKEDLDNLLDGANPFDIELLSAAALIKENSQFKSFIRFALKNPDELIELARTIFHEQEILGDPVGFVGVSCRQCFKLDGISTYIDEWDRVQFECASCGHKQEADIIEQSYWIHEYLFEAAVICASEPTIKIIRAGENEKKYEYMDKISNLVISGYSREISTLIIPNIDSERGGYRLNELIDLAKDWEKPEAEIA